VQEVLMIEQKNNKAFVRILNRNVSFAVVQKKVVLEILQKSWK
jgi:hypothetical protein